MEQRVAIVTASGRGIGAACARRLAQEGYRVSLMSRSDGAMRLAQELGGIGQCGDVRVSQDLEKLVSVTMASYGRIDAIVNNTGDPFSADLLDLPDEQWHIGLDLILLNVSRISKLVTPIMIRQGGGSIVNISASDAYEPNPRFPIGSTLRAALGAWTKLYAARFAAEGIRMNCVSPGIALPDSPGPIRDDIVRSVPMGRPARYTEIANLVRFLLSDEAQYITGEDVRIDGGLTRYI
jgi:NAD(P)-dependent dehydrogenase (short-subunit alcohol dehydrogenase family)